MHKDADLTRIQGQNITKLAPATRFVGTLEMNMHA